jgi:hypothetical protein
VGSRLVMFGLNHRLGGGFAFAPAKRDSLTLTMSLIIRHSMCQECPAMPWIIHVFV